MSHATVKVYREGKPLRETEVSLEQKSHAFLFGCNAFDLLNEGSPYEGEVGTNAATGHSGFLEQFNTLFNFATLPFYWGSFEPVEGQPRKRELLEAARQLKANGHVLKGHPLCWHTVCADWLMQYDTEEIHQRQMARIRREVADFNGLIDMWDVINETVIMPVFDKYDNAVTRLCNHLGRPALMKEVFAAARSENPSAMLLLNDFDLSPAYERVIEESLEVGVEFDAVGIQSHMHQGYWGLEKLREILDRYSRFKKPIHFTELTMLSGDTFVPSSLEDLNDYQVDDWPSTPEGEARQAEEVCEFYTALFEHPSVEAITWWDFSDGKWLNAPAGLVRKDMSPKPAFEALRKLVRERWWTPRQTLTTDTNGEVVFSGFSGSYEIVVGGESRVVNVSGPQEGKEPTFSTNHDIAGLSVDIRYRTGE